MYCLLVEFYYCDYFPPFPRKDCNTKKSNRCCKMLAIELILVLCTISDSIAVDDSFTDVANQSVKISTFCEHDHLVKCTDGNTLLSLGYCATQNNDQSVFLAKCPYFDLRGHNVTKPGYIRLPDNISELNEYMCGTMNRKGLLCKDCIDGFGPSMTSLGYKCSNCRDAWYGIPLFLAVEFLPITLFYIIILIFKANLTSAPFVRYIFYSQLIMFELVFARDVPLEKVVPEVDGSPLLSSVLFSYGIWNLDFARYILPPFCVSSKLQIIDIELLSYISVVYPLFLIFLTWVCVELHGWNFKPFVLFWKPFHKCFVRLQRECNTRNDIIDVFASFFLLAYNKLMYQIVLFARCLSLQYKNNSTSAYRHKFVMMFDMDIDCLSGRHWSFLVPMVVFSIVFNILPALLLVFYPFKLFRRCSSKCRLDSLLVSTFVEKFHGCYRDGLDGGRDMRSFSGLYFFVICLTSIVFKILKLPPSVFASFVILAFALLVAFLKPYKQTYMNFCNTLLLAHLTVISILFSSKYILGNGTEVFALVLIPAALFKLIVFFKILKMLKKKTGEVV